MGARIAPMVLALLALSGAALAARQQPGEVDQADDNRRGDFDYFYLVRQWPATFCNDHSCTHRPPRKYAFTVHGLWPQRRDGTWPEFCSPGRSLHEEDIWDLLPALERVWPSWSSDDESFWGHEWSRHGTCAAAVVGGPHSFFKAVLDLHSKLNVQRALDAAGIEPSNRRHYSLDDVTGAIDEEYGVMPHVTCDDKGELAEVWMCINKKLRPIDCVEGPHPHLVAAVRGLAGANATQLAPPNYSCGSITIPKLRHGRVGSAQDGDDEEEEVGWEKEEEEPMAARCGHAVGAAAAAAAGRQHLALAAAAVGLVAVAAAVAAAVTVQAVRQGGAAAPAAAGGVYAALAAGEREAQAGGLAGAFGGAAPADVRV